MAGGTFNYQSPNYHESQPFPIESELAKTVTGDNASLALPWLLSYQAQRRDAQGDYNAQIADQHQFARDSLQAHIADELQKNFIGLTKEPASLNLAQGSPIGGQLLQGIPTNLVQQQVQQNQLDSLAKRQGEALSGAGRAYGAGVIPNLPSLEATTGGPVQLGQSSLEKAAAIRAASGEGRGGTRETDKEILAPDKPDPANPGKTIPGAVISRERTVQSRGGGKTSLAPKQPATPAASTGASAAPAQATATGPVTAANWQQLSAIAPDRYRLIASAASHGMTKVDPRTGYLVSAATGHPM